jgi:hypothetical protein
MAMLSFELKLAKKSTASGDAETDKRHREMKK